MMLKLFKCGFCGNIHEGDDAPEVCPKCGSPKDKYAQLPEEAAQLVMKSRKTNRYHTQVLEHLAQAADIAAKGVEDNLDPTCVKVFGDILASAKVLQGEIRAELAGHVGKGKWG